MKCNFLVVIYLLDYVFLVISVFFLSRWKVSEKQNVKCVNVNLKRL